jgi:MFS family permease
VLLSERPAWSEAEIGLALAAMSLPMALLSPVGGRLSDQVGRRIAAVTGLALLTAGLLPLGIAGEHVAAPVLSAARAISGAGLGLSNAAVQAAGVEALDPGDAGIAAGVFSTGRYLGGIAAASLVAALANGASARYGLLFSFEMLAALLSTVCAIALPGQRPAIVPLRA